MGTKEDRLRRLMLLLAALAAGLAFPAAAHAVYGEDPTLPHQPVITGGPEFSGDGRTATFTFTSDEPGVTFRCALDSEELIRPCTSPYTRRDIEQNGYQKHRHVFYVDAVDSSGAASLYAHRNFTIGDPEGRPVTTVLWGEQWFRDRDPTFIFHTFTPTGEAVTNECRVNRIYVDNAGPGRDREYEGGWEACTSPVTYTALQQTIDGPWTGPHWWVGPLYLFQVRATDSSGDTDERTAGHNFRFDTIPPNTEIDPVSGAGKVAVTSKRRATFRFRSTDIGGAWEPTFACKLDRRPWRACSTKKTYRRLKRGRHTLKVRATDQAGNVERKRARYRWRVR